MKRLWRCSTYMAAFVLVAFFPLLPVTSAPVVAPIGGVYGVGESATLASLFDLLNVFRVGVTYRAGWLTLLVLVVMLAVAWVAARAIANRLVPLQPGRPQSING